MNASHKFQVFVAAALPCVLLDQITKGLAESTLRFGTSVSHLGGLINMEYAENRGALWGFGATLGDLGRFLSLILVALLLIAWLFRALVRASAPSLLETMGYSLMIAGGLGNVLDRLTAGYVVDFVSLRLGPVHTGVFNVADVAIGLGLLQLCWIESKRFFVGH